MTTEASFAAGSATRGRRFQDLRPGQPCSTPTRESCSHNIPSSRACRPLPSLLANTNINTNTSISINNPSFLHRRHTLSFSSANTARRVGPISGLPLGPGLLGASCHRSFFLRQIFGAGSSCRRRKSRRRRCDKCRRALSAIFRITTSSNSINNFHRRCRQQQQQQPDPRSLPEVPDLQSTTSSVKKTTRASTTTSSAATSTTKTTSDLLQRRRRRRRATERTTTSSRSKPWRTV